MNKLIDLYINDAEDYFRRMIGQGVTYAIETGTRTNSLML